MEVVEVSNTVLFEEMLRELGLPNPTYRTRITEGSKLVASITFYPATRCLGLSYGAISLSGQPMDSLHAAKSDAAKQAIIYMENTEHKILKDYSYDKVTNERKTEDRYINMVIENNRRTSDIIKEKDEKIKQITRHWDDFITDVANTNDIVTKIAEEGYTNGATQLDNDINHTLWEVQKGTAHLDQLTFESTDLLRKIGKYPYDTDTETSEADQFPGYYPSPPASPVDATDSDYSDCDVYNKYALFDMSHHYM